LVWQNNVTRNNNGFLYSIISGITFTIILAILLILIVATVVYFSNLQEHSLYLLSLLILVISVFLGGYRAAKRTGKKGLVTGGGVGLGFFLIILLITFFIVPETLSAWNILIRSIYCLLAGALGGISAVTRM